MWSGYTIPGAKIEGYEHLIQFYMLFWGQESEALKAVQILKDAVAKHNNEIELEIEIENEETFWDWHYQNADPVGDSTLLASRLILTENLATCEAREALTDALLATKQG